MTRQQTPILDKGWWTSMTRLFLINPDVTAPIGLKIPEAEGT